MNENYFFKDVTLLVTHYNRSKSLERLLSSLANLHCEFEDTVVSDDASRPEEMEQVRKLQAIYKFRLVTTPQNKGYGNCINKGQDVINTPYTLYLQEDFVPFDVFPVHFKDALQIMNEDKSIDYTRFWAIENLHIDMKPYGKGFSEMVYKFWNMHHLKFYQFSDTPNIRRNTFVQKFGRYREGVHGDITDYYMAISFLHNKGKGLFYNDYESLFTHDNSEEASTIRPLINWRQKRSPLTLALRFFFLRYKWFKGTWLVLFFKPQKPAGSNVPLLLSSLYISVFFALQRLPEVFDNIGELIPDLPDL